MGAIGKTQIALRYVDKYVKKDELAVFIDCENIERFRACLEEVAKNWGKGLNSLLAEGEMIFLIIDNVDDEKLADAVSSLLKELPPRSNCNVIITGRYDTCFPNRIDVDQVTYADGLSIFQATLYEIYRPSFDNETEEAKKAFISERLGGNPLLIRMAAMYFNIQSLGKPKLLTIEEYCKDITALNPAALAFLANYIPDQIELEYTKTLKMVSMKSVNLIALKIRSAICDKPEMVRDVLRFFAFFGMLQNIPLPQDSSMKALLDAFKDSNANVYTFTEESFRICFKTIIEELRKHALIELSSVPNETTNKISIVTIPQIVKVAVQCDFLEEEAIVFEEVEKEISEYHKTCKEGRLSYWLYPVFGYLHPAVYEEKKRNELDQKRIAWFFRVCDYFNAITDPGQFERDYLSILISFIEFVNTNKFSDHLKAIFINKLRIWQAICNAFRDNNQLFIQKIQDLPTQEFYKLLEALVKLLEALVEKPGGRKESKYDLEIAKAIANIGKLYMDSDPKKAKKLFRIALRAHFIEVHFDLGLLYLNRARKEKDEEKRKEYYKKAIYHYSFSILIPRLAATSYNNRGHCQQVLHEFRLAIQDYQNAISLKPDHPLFYSNLATVFAAKKKDSESKRNKEIAQNLTNLQKMPEYKTIGEKYKKAFLKLFTSTGTFAVHGSYQRPFKEDGGVLFGQFLNANSTLKEFKLYGCDLSDEGVRAIAESLKSNQTIEVLHLEWNRKITDVGIRSLADALRENKNIRKLSLDHNSNISSESIIYLINNAPAQLEEISLIGCVNKASLVQILSLDKSNQWFIPEGTEAVLRRKISEVRERG